MAPLADVVVESVKQRTKLRVLMSKIDSGYIPCYVSEDGPWFVKFNGIDPSWYFLDAYTAVNYAFWNINVDLCVFPLDIAKLVLEWLDFRRSTRIAARISIKSDRRRLGNVLERADRLFPYDEYDAWLAGA